MGKRLNLAILVVFMIDPKREDLIRLFVKQIRANTTEPFQIFASVNHLSSAQRARISSEPDVTLVECQIGRALRGRVEHATLLEALRVAATEAGATHFVTMHLDSFPISPTWAGDLLERLATGDRFATIVPNGYSACLFWSRDLDRELRLEFLVSESNRASADFEKFRRCYPDYDHIETGLGFIYEAWKRGWSWHPLKPTGHNIYGDAMFHLVAGVRLTAIGEGPIKKTPVISMLRRIGQPLMQVMPQSLRRQVREAFVHDEIALRDGTRRSKREELDSLLMDPETYLARCRISSFQ
jgi:hypothetical protein